MIHGSFTIIGYANGCNPCLAAKSYLDARGLSYKFFAVEEHPVVRDFINSCGFHTLPQIWYGTEHIGGRDELKKFLGVD